jgi:hypothetical protein
VDEAETERNTRETQQLDLSRFASSAHVEILTMIQFKRAPIASAGGIPNTTSLEIDIWRLGLFALGPITFPGGKSIQGNSVKPVITARTKITGHPTSKIAARIGKNDKRLMTTAARAGKTQ